MFLLFGILQFHVGVRLTPIAQAERGFLRRQAGERRRRTRGRVQRRSQ